MAKELSIRCTGADSVLIEELHPFQDDIKTMTPSVLKKLENVLIQHGFSEPISVWGNAPDGKKWILNGHQRLTALKSLQSKGWFIPPIPVAYIDADDEFEARKKVLTLASQFGDFQQDHMAEFVAKAQLDMNWVKDNTRLAAGDFKWPVLVTPTDEDEVPAPPEVPMSKRGDVYRLGNHRLMCGDSTLIDEVEKLLGGHEPELVFTDPPYRQITEVGKKGTVGEAMAKVNRSIEHLCDFNPQDFLSTLSATFKSGSMNAYVFCNKDLVPDYLNWAVDSRYSFNILFWKKPSAIPVGMSHYPDVEYLLLFRRTATWNAYLPGVSYSKCLEHGREHSEDHPTLKPIALIENQLRISSSPKGIVLDMFGGSGSTLIACEKTDRQCFMMELEPRYCDVIIQRWENLTGQKAELVEQVSTDD